MTNSPLKEPIIVVCDQCGEDPADGCALDCPCDECRSKREADIVAQAEMYNRIFAYFDGLHGRFDEDEYLRQQVEAEALARDCRHESHRIDEQTANEINKARP